MQDASSLKRFEAWLKHTDQGIHIHPALRIRRHTNKPGFGVYAQRSIKEDEIIMRVPKKSLLSAQTCAIANVLEQGNFDDMVAVCLAFLYERHLGQKSPWYAYIAMMPDRVPISKLWSKDRRRLLHGTEVQVVGGTTLSDFHDMYNTDVLPFLQAHKDLLSDWSQALTFEAFCSGMSIVGSRAFEVDAFHKLALCPFADMLDHALEEHVHFTTRYDACEVCGESDNCHHSNSDVGDSDTSIDSGSDHSAAGESEDENHEENTEDLCDLITCRKVRAASEVFNTYGECGNDVLLARYGFAVLENHHDRLSLMPELSRFPQSAVYISWLETNLTALTKALTWPESMQPVLEDETDAELEDLLFIRRDGSFSIPARLFCMLLLIDPTELPSLTGPQIKERIQNQLDSHDYLTNLLPLPTNPALDLVQIKRLSEAMHRVIQSRSERNKSVLKHSGIESDLNRLDARISSARDNADWEEHFSLIVIRNEQAICHRAAESISHIDNAQAWLADREN
jgi:hypothetical protein